VEVGLGGGADEFHIGEVEGASIAIEALAATLAGDLSDTPQLHHCTEPEGGLELIDPTHTRAGEEVGYTILIPLEVALT